MATLQIDFTVPTPSPVNGFIVKYRKVGTTTYTTVFPNPTSSPVIITVPSTDSYEGTIQSDCGNSSTSPTYNFIAYAFNEITTLTGTTISSMCSSSPIVLYIKKTFSDIVPGLIVYTDMALTTPFTGGGYITNAFGLIYTITSTGLVTGTSGSVCGQLFTSIAAGTGIGGSSQVAAACASSASGVKYISFGDIIQIGTIVYQNSALTIVSGPFSFKINGNKVVTTNSSGEITAITDC